ncbi:hypothetical protein TVAG_124840 [Trichomonas vaginalis G3]|uniref:Heparinase II/III-like C-terminal domain-containing protein n=1 Tax=Trichomonas vaginalis (strain ATCC PRA-98 / G3) TaxID=412133 RepID=A2EIJ0_TRIV3|nr:chondroitin AC/alginate lyase family protein family [Trichomonas vaginalis G3]EAY07511.1 hypothetical protein TVAG_124840 [Trichomonas vaginalis G3]KAI5550535.1 chondroitin AC/alginate lyase family protein family [Trichomonas vaginalis G3]|eukprot:XP_001319734.1 hypothetical protein [Trichomonas vaginalis G3]
MNDDMDSKQKRTRIMVTIATIAVIVICIALIIYSIVYNVINNKFKRPMLFIKNGDEAEIMKAINSDSVLNSSYKTLVKSTDKILNTSVLTYTLKGKRLLEISREAVRRIFFCSTLFRLTDDKKYYDKALAEINAVCAFEDWHPSHFLDVAEMTTAVSIGYDWLYNNLTKKDRESIRQCIIKNGINPSLNKSLNYFLRTTNNWNQVCNSGMTLAAIALRDTDLNLSDYIINRSVNSLKISMGEYSPDGNYPEGYGYWGYGTTYAGIMFAALDRFFGHTYEMAEWPGFAESGKYIQYMVGTSGLNFNYYDSGEKGGINPILFWFAYYFDDPSYIFYDNYLMDVKKMTSGSYYLPLILIYGSKLKRDKIKPPEKKIFYGKGTTPVILVRTSWDGANGTSFGIKGGRAKDSHAHMDAGSFVFDALGVRWASDLGSSDYTTLEAEGVDLWNFKQNSTRWSMLRLGTIPHNTITIEGERHNVEAKSNITKVYDSDDNKLGGQIDITENFFGKLKSAVRDAILINQKYLEITDNIIGGNSKVNIVWTMTTRANTTLTDSKTVTLTNGKKTCILNVKSPSDCTISFGDNKPSNDFEESNEGTKKILIKTSVAAGESKQIKVTLTPQ